MTCDDCGLPVYELYDHCCGEYCCGGDYCDCFTIEQWCECEPSPPPKVVVPLNDLPF